MWIFRVRKVQIALVAFVVVMALIARSGAPRSFLQRAGGRKDQCEADERGNGVTGLDDPAPEENPVVLPLRRPPRSPRSLRRLWQRCWGARIRRASMRRTTWRQSRRRPRRSRTRGRTPTTPKQWAEQVVSTAWASDPWEDRAEYKTTDTFTAQKVTESDTGEFLDFFAPDSSEVQEYLEGRGLVVMEVQGTLLRELTDPDDGVRKQADMGETTWSVAMLCAEE